MKEQIRRLHLIFLLTELKPEMFYVISCYKNRIVMQGKYTQESIEAAQKLMEMKLTEQNFIEGKDRNLEIVLTY